MKSKNQQKRIRRTRRLLRGGKPVTTGDFESGLNQLKTAFSQLETVKNQIISYNNSVKGDDYIYVANMKPILDTALPLIVNGYNDIFKLNELLIQENRIARENEYSAGVGQM